MKPIIPFLVIITVFAATFCTPAGKTDGICHIQDGNFTICETPYYYIGTNFWYGPILAADCEGGNYARLTAELDSLKALGIDNLRVLAGGDGLPGVPTRIEPVLQPEPGVYNEELFVGLDRFLVELGKRDMKAVLYLNNSWEWSGGYWQYLEWAGAGKAVIPSIDGWQYYMATAGQFLVNDKAKELFANHVEKVVSRVNSITGKPYKDDPAIFSWQICNEPRCFSNVDSVRVAFVDWLWDAAAQIRSLDPNHLISTGNEGLFGCEGDIDLYEKIHSCPDIDYLTIHIWPYNWNWISDGDVQGGVQTAIDHTERYIDIHVELAEKYSKPLVIEEFGYPRDDFQFAKGSPTMGRDTYYSYIFNRIIESKNNGGKLAGLNFWSWGGLAGQSEENIYWQKGDDYCGDPAQEQQGLNSVYLSDETTMEILRDCERRLAATQTKTTPIP
ncbi:MAG: beta-galactosidase [Bacteroidales bacterium]|nr:beta-galactosidase [Bacteroidales bacterium]